MITMVHGRACVRRDGRFYAVSIPRKRDIADAIARRTHSTGNFWERVQRSSKTARVQINQR